LFRDDRNKWIILGRKNLEVIDFNSAFSSSEVKGIRFFLQKKPINFIINASSNFTPRETNTYEDRVPSVKKARESEESSIYDCI